MEQKNLTMMHQLDQYKCSCFPLVDCCHTRFAADLLTEGLLHDGNLFCGWWWMSECATLTCSVCLFSHHLDVRGSFIVHTQRLEDATRRYVLPQLQHHNTAGVSEQWDHSFFTLVSISWQQFSSLFCPLRFCGHHAVNFNVLLKHKAVVINTILLITDSTHWCIWMFTYLK